MAHNSYIHGGIGNGAAWISGYVLTQLDLQSIDQYLFESINGDQGGTWAPATRIIVGGQGIQISTFLRFANASTLDYDSGSVTVSSSGFQVGSGFPAEFLGPVTLGGSSVTVNTDITVTGAGHLFSIAASADTPTLASGLHVTAGATTLDGGLRVSAGTTTLDGPIAVNGNTTVSSTTSHLGALQMVGPNSIHLLADATVRWRPAFSMIDSSAVIVGPTTGSGGGPATGADTVVVQTGALSTNRTVKVTASGALTGMRIRFKTYDSVNALTIVNDVSATVCTLKAGTVAANGVHGAPPAGFWNWVDLEFAGGSNYMIIGGQSA